jgi:threonine/homoserine/homoserine lactone efflux protein
MSTLLAFLPVAALLTITPGAATAMVVRNATRGGRRHALACTVGNEVGVIAKLAVFYVALFPQFVPAGEPVLPYALAMAGLVALLDPVWYSTLALAVTRARKAFVEGPWGRRIERATGAVLIALGIRLALERR